MELQKIIKENQEWIDEIFCKLDTKLSKVALRSREKLPYSAVDGEHTERKPYWWTNGFWGGLMCLMYESTKKQVYKDTLDRAEQLLDRAFSTFSELHHDVGFMWHLTSVAKYRLFGDNESLNRGLMASSILISRYNFDGKYIRAWNGVVRGDDSKGLTIIDSMLNLPLLYWCSEQTGGDKPYKIATAQADMTMRDHVRKDGGVNHVVLHNPDDGKMITARAGQGYLENSLWSRGQSWAIYGFVLSYIHTKDKKYLDTAIKVADLFIKETEKTDWVPRIDFCQPDEVEGFDTSAGVVTACGLIEIAKALPEGQGEKYILSAIKMLKAIEKKWCDWSESNDGVLFGSSESYAGGWHKNIIYGDFYFAEAILKLKGSTFLIW